MSVKILTDSIPGEKKTDAETLDPVIEVNENVATEVFDRPSEENQIEEISPKIFGLLDITEPLTIDSLNNAIYELGVINLCWPEIKDPVFEMRTCFPQSYYINTNKERLLLAYAENFRRQFLFHYKSRKPLFMQAPNDCGLQKMVCTSIRPTKLCFADTNTWQGVASLVSDYFDYEPLRKPMLQVPTVITIGRGPLPVAYGKNIYGYKQRADIRSGGRGKRWPRMKHGSMEVFVMMNQLRRLPPTSRTGRLISRDTLVTGKR